MELYEKIKYMCSRNLENCNDCPLDGTSDLYSCFLCDEPDKWLDRSEIEPIIDKWIEDHPIKTRKSEFMKLFPNCGIKENGDLKICPQNLDETIVCSDYVTCSECGRKFWSQEIE